MSGCNTAGRGLFGAANAVPMRQGPPAMTRPPSITATPPPAIASTTVMTAAGVVGYGRDPDNTSFDIVCMVPPAGLLVGATGTIVVAISNDLTLPSGYFVAASWASFTKTGSNTAVSLNWTATEAIRGSARMTIHVEKMVSV